MLDSRVAHNIVRNSLPMVGCDPRQAIIRALAFTTAQLSRVRTSGGLTTRDLRRKIEKRVIPNLKAHGNTVGLIEIDGAPVLQWVFICGDSTSGLLALGFGVRVTDCKPIGLSLVSITPHAIARFLQRTGNPEFLSVAQTTLHATLAAACILRKAFFDAGCKQVAIPAGDGLFVGEFNDKLPVALDDLPHDIRACFVNRNRHFNFELGTWFVPCLNGRDSRWRQVNDYFGPRMRLLDRLPAPALLLEIEQTERHMMTSPTISERFPHLRKPYERREDSEEMTWLMARQQAQQGESIGYAG
jgi:hypothetical protein